MVKIKQYANTIKNGNKGGFKIMKIEHVAMYVNNLEQAKDFFVGYLDGKTAKQMRGITIKRQISVPTLSPLGMEQGWRS